MKRPAFRVLALLLLLGMVLFTGCAGESGAPETASEAATSQEMLTITDAEPDGRAAETESSSGESASEADEDSGPGEAQTEEAVEADISEEEDGAEAAGQEETGAETGSVEAELDEDGTYTSKEDVALYLHLYGHLPDNYITKKEAEKLGWDSREGNLQEVAPGKSIGGSRFGNYEGLLPDAKGRTYYECDINYEGGYRGAERIIFSDDGLVFYTADHYKSFEQLY